MAGPLTPIIKAVGNYIAEKGIKAAIKKFGKKAVDEAKTVKTARPKAGTTKPAAKPAPKSSPAARPKAGTKPAAKSKPGTKPKAKTPRDYLESTFGRKRTGPTPKPSDSRAFRSAEKAARKEADEKLNPSLRNSDLPRASIESRMSDVRSQLRELMKSEKPDFKAIDRLQNRLENLKGMKSDRPDLTTMGGKFSRGGLSATHKDYRKTGLFK